MTTELEQAIAIVKSNEFTAENYKILLTLAEETGDSQIGDMIEAFIAASPNVDYMDNDEL